MVNTWNPQSQSPKQMFGSMRAPGPQWTPPPMVYSQGPAQPAPQPRRTPAFGMTNEQYGAGVNAQSAKDQAAMNAAAQFGIAGQNAMGQYGMGQQQALVNSQIAQANALGQMGNSYYNMMGQLGQYGAGLGAAGAMAGAESNKANALGGGLSGLFGGGGGFGGGIHIDGPGGMVASGSWGGGSNWGGGGGAGGGGSFRPGQQYSPMDPLNRGFGFLDGLRRDVQAGDSDANRIRRDMGGAFQATQKNLMDPGVRNALMQQMSMGYGALNGLYGGSDYGFNTARRRYDF